MTGLFFMEQGLNDYRCYYCYKLLFKGWLFQAKVEVKCKKCSHLNTFYGQKNKSDESKIGLE